jgi:uncharacterized protein (TIRG00374 family)
MGRSDRRSPQRRIAWGVIRLTLAAIAFYVLAPGLVELLGDAPRLLTIDPWWLVVMVVLQSASFVALWQLHHVALGCDDRMLVATSQLAGNAFSRVVPGGAAAAGALQFRMLVRGGVAPGAAATGLTAIGLITIGALLALPVLSIPAVLAGAPVPDGLAQAAILGAAAFVVVFGVSFLAMSSDAPLRVAAGGYTTVRTRVLHRPPPPGDLAAHLLAQRDEVRGALGRRWPTALAAAVGNRLLDYFCLLAALQAVGAEPRPSLVLFAYVAAAVLGMIPITPGGLGFVEAGLAAMLRLAGVAGGDAILATLAYRFVSYWLPLPAGAVAYAIFQRRTRVAT